ncbi:glycan-binding surface protein [Mucilaginibacter gotjawali]|uniref:Surface glycan-binding protein B xyloglucan binding domain-containing protein n=2 Tax=Mucilaginibacter gotjawali TaxID=1550579 RepID=A0A0X8X1R5_9SPHI|nr:glycan-binding surface protein [Mucilaginibacter gotjawali]MBB3053783.1 hypothetical protein [Mucilaginibacter gotjawali]BAU54046.1 hypothetical protein MgSA37_02217 [Mucilaginibacter gotjawali]
MKKKSLIGLCLLPLLLAMVALFPACKKNNEGAPSISDVRQYVASPKDTILSTGNPSTSPALYGNGGNYVVIQGSNLQNPIEIDFDGVPSSFNPALITANNAVVPIPTINYTTVDTARLYSIIYKTKAGSTSFWFKLGPAKPTISAISNVFANPGDSVYLYGANLVLVQQFLYGGTKITSYKSSSDGSSLGFLMPASTPTSLITVTTKSGTVLDTIKATPTISGISNENPTAGDSVYIYGTYLKSIQSLTFAGTAITSFTESKDTKSVSFVMPQLSSNSGPVSVTTKFGTGTTIYKVNSHTYLQDGVIETMDGPMWTFGGMGGWWAAGSGGIDDAANDQYGWFTHTTDFDGVLGKDKTQFVYLNTGLGNSGDGQWYNGWGTDLSGNQWVPKANLTDDPGSWALKLEVSVAKGWNGGALDISPGGGFIYRWEPWKTGKAYKTKGWITLTIPLSSFRASDPTLGEGMGASLAKLTDMLDQSGNATAYIYVHNYATTKTTTGFYGAFDNIRVVKIK